MDLRVVDRIQLWITWTWPISSQTLSLWGIKAVITKQKPCTVCSVTVTRMPWAISAKWRIWPFLKYDSVYNGPSYTASPSAVWMYTFLNLSESTRQKWNKASLPLWERRTQDAIVRSPAFKVEHLTAKFVKGSVALACRWPCQGSHLYCWDHCQGAPLSWPNQLLTGCF